MACSGIFLLVCGWGLPPVFFGAGGSASSSLCPYFAGACTGCWTVLPTGLWIVVWRVAVFCVPRLCVRCGLRTRAVRPAGWGSGSGLSNWAVVSARSLERAGSRGPAAAGVPLWGCSCRVFPPSLCQVSVFCRFNCPLARGGLCGRAVVSVGGG